MERLKSMKECFIAQVQGQLGNLSQVDTKELGEVVDMIKDLEEAIYYCTITKAMEAKENEDKHGARYYTPVYPRDMDRYDQGRMYYGPDSTHKTPYKEKDYPIEFRDMREGKSPISRKMYMESKEMHHDKSKQMQELEKYMKELSEDIVEMVEDATPEEKQILHQKLSHLISTIK